MVNEAKIQVNFLTMLKRLGLKSCDRYLFDAMSKTIQNEVDNLSKQMGRKLEKDLYYPEDADK